MSILDGFGGNDFLDDQEPPLILTYPSAGA
jgi:hypothetical protein